MAIKPIYFKGLNELRAIAALSVLWYHIELYKSFQELPNLFNQPFIQGFFQHLGSNGVWLFFTLSGFLITYLLLAEKRETGTISVSKFYLRRVLRIWPLYYIIVLIGFIGMPILFYQFSDFFSGQTNYNNRIMAISYGENFLLFIFFMSNISMRIFPTIAGSAQTWSVSVEEQFYLLWPWIVKIFHQYILWVLLVFILIIPRLLKYLAEGPFGNEKHFSALVSTFSIEFMATGGLMAYLYFNHEDKVRSVIKNYLTLTITIAGCFLMLYIDGYQNLKAIFYALLIITSIEWGFHSRVLNFLGKISYGIYMYHPLMMYLFFALLDNLSLNNTWSNLFLYISIPAATVGISLFSYQFIELPLLKLKDKFTIVKSGKIKI